MAFESGVVLEGWRSAVIFLLYKGKGERTECKNYRGISQLSVFAKNIFVFYYGLTSICDGYLVHIIEEVYV